jgi:hypothetical protein
VKRTLTVDQERRFAMMNPAEWGQWWEWLHRALEDNDADGTPGQLRIVRVEYDEGLLSTHRSADDGSIEVLTFPGVSEPPCWPTDE